MPAQAGIQAGGRRSNRIGEAHEHFAGMTERTPEASTRLTSRNRSQVPELANPTSARYEDSILEDLIPAIEGQLLEGHVRH